MVGEAETIVEREMSFAADLRRLTLIKKWPRINAKEREIRADRQALIRPECLCHTKLLCIPQLPLFLGVQGFGFQFVGKVSRSTRTTFSPMIL